MEKYSFENHQIVIVDPELKLDLKDEYHAMTIPKNSVNRQPVTDDSEIHITDFKDGSSEISIKQNGTRHGQCVMLYPDKAVKMELFYKNGTLHGPSRFYSNNGELLSEGWYFEGQRQGKLRWYYSTGQLYSLQRFYNNLWHGKQEYYYRDGKEKSLLNYTEGLLDGVVSLYSPNGEIKRSLHYQRGTRIHHKDTKITKNKKTG